MAKTKEPKKVIYDINWEAVNTVDDIKTLLKSIELRIVITKDDVFSLKKEEYLKFKNLIKLN